MRPATVRIPRGGQVHEPGHLVSGAVPSADFGQPVSRAHIVTVRPCRHVAVQQGIGQLRVGGRELPRKLSAQSADVSLDQSARVVSHQAQHLPVHTGAAQVARSIERVEPGLHQVGGVPDVMQPGRCHQVIRQAQHLRNPPCPAGYRADMPPAPRQSLSELGFGERCRVLNVHHNLDRTPG